MAFDGDQVTSVQTTASFLATATGPASGAGSGAFFGIDFTVSQASLVHLDVSLSASSNDSGDAKGNVTFDSWHEPEPIQVRSGGPTSASITRSLELAANSIFSFVVSGGANADWDLGGPLQVQTVASWTISLTVEPATCPVPAQEDVSPAGFDLELPTLDAEADATDADAQAECEIATVGFLEQVVGRDGDVEEGGSATVEFRLSHAVSEAVTVAYRTGMFFFHEAVSGDDYESREGTAVIPAGELFSIPIEIELIDDDQPEPDEAFGIEITSVEGPAGVQEAHAAVIIRDDDCGTHVPHADADNLGFVAPAAAPGPICGSIFVDEITGTSAGELIVGGAGNDVIDGRGGDDTLVGGGGIDRIMGGSGNDSLYAWYPSLLAGSMLYTTPLETIEVVHERLSGGEGNDALFGSSWFDILRGGLGHDLLYGHGGPDSLEGNEGNDTLREGVPFSNDFDRDLLVGGSVPNSDIDVCSSGLEDEEHGCDV